MLMLGGLLETHSEHPNITKTTSNVVMFFITAFHEAEPVLFFLRRPELPCGRLILLIWNGTWEDGEPDD